ncbi:MAG: RDD family protein [Bacteroidia bacterium]|nr:RDD family protein [Bacteroidia bacterium]NNF30872.1 RDD family protein [Flavobacteriaceae bacterium]MBT8275422.1 RDD family protein [Bacteroidia bacterium]NNJ82175.1 RDD family protein [Flavobacteriaceae bacterium]NNK54485.1 RDD family protein [Flavobacteriaceae bacterium]
MDKFQIETAQNVNIRQNVAGVGDRILAYLVDSIIIGIYIIIMVILFSWLEMDDDLSFIVIMTVGLPVFLYHLLFEMFWNGQSPGKRVMKLRVVKVDGSKPAFSNYLIRWLMRIVDLTLTSGALALVTILLNGKGQRLGDIAATTTVISEKPTMSLAQTLLVDIPEDYEPMYPQVTVFNDNEMQTIKSVYNDAKYDGNHNVILKLAAKVSDVMEIKYEGSPMAFVNKVIQDYNFYTQR